MLQDSAGFLDTGSMLDIVVCEWISCGGGEGDPVF